MTDFLLISGKLNNRQKPLRLGKLPEDQTILSTLVEADNVDFDNNGETTQRLGRTLQLAGSQHSLWAHPKDDSIAYFVEDEITVIPPAPGPVVELFGDVNLTNQGYWTLPAGWVHTGTYLHSIADPTFDAVSDFIPTIGITYDIEVDIYDYVNGLPNLKMGGNSGPTMNVNGTYSFQITAINTDPLVIDPFGFSNDYKFSRISVKDSAGGIPGDFIVDGGFNDDTKWTANPGSWSISGSAVATNANAPFFQRGPEVKVGDRFRTRFDIISVQSGGFKPNIAGVYGTVYSSPGSVDETIIATSDSAEGTFGVQVQGLTTGEIDNFSVVQVDENGDPVSEVTREIKLKKLNADFTATDVVTLGSNSNMSFVTVNNEIVCSNGDVIGWLKDLTFTPFSKALSGRFEKRTPAGQYLSFFRGVLYVASGSELYASKPWNIEVMDSRKCMFPMASWIRMMAAVEDGIWIATEKELGFISGKGTDKFEYDHRTDSVPPDGAFLVEVEESEKEAAQFVTWVSEEGFCQGTDGGTYVNLSGNAISLPNGPTGHVFRVFNNGIRQYVAVIHGPDYTRTYTPPTLDTNVDTI